MSSAAWIAVDWGTTALRAWSMNAAGEVLQEARSDAGMSSLKQADFEPTLLRLITPWLSEGPTDVMICGMAGARQGWAEAPYRSAPCSAAPDAAMRLAQTDPRLNVYILPGVKQDQPADVMRGEETQIAGFCARHPDWDGTLVLPGTHSKWAQISAQEIVSFRTAMTGEMFALLSQQSVLRFGLSDDGWDDSAFDDGVSEGLSRPEHLPTTLFALRAERLLHDLDSAAARARLSGLVIGWELAATRPYWLGAQVGLVGDGALSAHYARALSQQGVSITQTSARGLTLEGLTAARKALSEVAS